MYIDGEFRVCDQRIARATNGIITPLLVLLHQNPLLGAEICTTKSGDVRQPPTAL